MSRCAALCWTGLGRGGSAAQIRRRADPTSARLLPLMREPVSESVIPAPPCRADAGPYSTLLSGTTSLVRSASRSDRMQVRRGAIACKCIAKRSHIWSSTTAAPLRPGAPAGPRGCLVSACYPGSRPQTRLPYHYVAVVNLPKMNMRLLQAAGALCGISLYPRPREPAPSGSDGNAFPVPWAETRMSLQSN